MTEFVLLDENRVSVHTDDVKRRSSHQEYQVRTFLAILLFAGSIALVGASFAGVFTSQPPAAATPSSSTTPDATILDV
jgi:hypothetical protein